MTPTHQVTVSVLASSPIEADQKAKLIAEISKHIDMENLQILAKAASKPGINQKIQQFKMFL